MERVQGLERATLVCGHSNAHCVTAVSLRQRSFHLHTVSVHSSVEISTWP